MKDGVLCENGIVLSHAETETITGLSELAMKNDFTFQKKVQHEIQSQSSRTCLKLLEIGSTGSDLKRKNFLVPTSARVLQRDFLLACARLGAMSAEEEGRILPSWLWSRRKMVIKSDNFC